METAGMSKVHPAVDTPTLLAFLGDSPQNSAFDTWLDRHGIFDRPMQADPNDFEAYQRAKGSRIEQVERYSLCLIYEEADSFERLFGYEPDEADFVLKQVAFYAKGVQDYRGYAGELPWGLRFTMSRADVHALLGIPTASRIVHELPVDLYLTEQAVINISYVSDGLSIAVVHVRPSHIFDKRMLGLSAPEIDELAVDLDRLTSCLGRSTYDETLDTVLDFTGWHASDFDMADCDEVMKLVPRHGLTLYYRKVADYPVLQGSDPIQGGSVFAGFRANRRGDMNSDGYAGKLPFGIEFHDTPERVVERVGRPPDWRLIDVDTGSFKWKLPSCTLHVLFSLIDYQVYRVTCFAKFLEPELFARTYE